MSAATIPLSPTLPLSPYRKSKPWQPADRDRLIFRWVRFEGLTQQWVARELNMHQTTVSRVLQRYERWIARGGPASEGALSREELLRYHHWLTIERNEHIIASALRLADELTRPFDTSTSTITHPPGQFGNTTQVRTENKVIDRSGSPCRYLRLAFRVGEAQLKLLAQDDLPPLDPLTEDDLDPTLDEELDRAIPTISKLLNPSPSSPPNPNPDPDPDPDLALNPPPPLPVAEGSPAIKGAPNPAVVKASVVVEGSRDPSTPPTEGLPAPQDNTITTVELSPSQPPLHKTHKPKRDLTLHSTTTSDTESRKQNFRRASYPPFELPADEQSSITTAPAIP